MREIREEVENLKEVLTGEIFSPVEYTDAKGEKRPMYEFGKKGAMQLALKYDAVTRYKVIEYLEKLEEKFKPKPLNAREMALLVIQQYDEIERLQIELDESKQWLTIKKVACHNSVDWKSLDWRKLKQVSIALGLIPRKIFDSNFPQGVNVYHKDVWKVVYPSLKLPNGEI
jgi:phage regulator Rha-like protein